MNYSEMSDIEINKLVAEASGIKILELIDSPAYGVIVGYEGQGEPVSYDPCNSPADAWPIILENKIDIQWSGHSALCLSFTRSDSSAMFRDESPLRAAMIVFLMMNEAKS